MNWWTKLQFHVPVERQSLFNLFHLNHRVYTCIPSMLLSVWSKQSKAVFEHLSWYIMIYHDLSLSFIIFHYLSLSKYLSLNWPACVYHILPLRMQIFHRSWPMWGVSRAQAGAAGCSERAWSSRPGHHQLLPDAVRDSERIPRQQVQTCDLLWIMMVHDG